MSELHFRNSVLREVIVEHLLVGKLLQRLWQRGIADAEILHSEFDAGGYDLVLSWRTVTRHIQLKTKLREGRTARVSVGLNLATKPSGCVIWIVLTNELEFVEFLWFGAEPGSPLPDISAMPIARHTKGNSEGLKGERANHRIVSRANFTSLKTLDDLIDKLLGPLPN
jgi:hypothetical protein